MDSSVLALLAQPWLIIAIHFYEASLHYALIMSRNDHYWWNRLWHIEFFRMWAIVYILLWLAGVDPNVLIIGVLARLTIFSIRLNLLREMKWTHLSNSGIDSLVSWMPHKGRAIYFIALSIAMLVIAVIQSVRVL